VFRHLELTIDLEPNLPRICTDRGQLQQVFLNLITNAIDAVKEKGHINLVCRVAGDYVVVSIIDDGPGIPNALTERIFKPFFTTKKSGQGTGLGLSISYSIMQKLGGRLYFKNRTGNGVAFYVKIPKILV
jgi:two-component system NtrC family sensor kinase